jgi:7-cyano-7-deazaguanine synthase
MSDTIAIVSGGLDSVTLLHYLYKRENEIPTVLTFTYGQKHSKEVEYARYHTNLLGCAEHEVVDISFLAGAFAQSALVSSQVEIPNVVTVLGDPQPPTYVPNRNMIFLAIGAAFAEGRNIGEVYYGAQRHDMYGYWDTTPQFLERLNAVFNLNRKTPIQIKAPFVNYSKADIVRLGLELGVDYGQTWSCYQGGEAACGVCPTCAERLKAFEEVGVADPLPYLERT